MNKRRANKLALLLFLFQKNSYIPVIFLQMYVLIRTGFLKLILFFAIVKIASSVTFALFGVLLVVTLVIVFLEIDEELDSSFTKTNTDKTNNIFLIFVPLFILFLSLSVFRK
ncbi:hypothetical protein [Priestia megaterium]|uniref:hypothetical protein n=1 Tax=Priestia megaterium TaxID=1404 RepID=UPI003101077B